MNTQVEGADKYILFELAGTSYGLASGRVRQIEMVAEAMPGGAVPDGVATAITPVPNAPPFVEGVVLSRGQVIPALSLRARFGLPPVPHDLRTRLIVVNPGERVVGLLVDAAREFVAIPGERLLPPPEALLQLTGRYVQAVANLGERLILILDVDRVVDAGSAATAAWPDAQQDRR